LETVTDWLPDKFVLPAKRERKYCCVHVGLCGSVAKNNSDIQFAYKIEVITPNFVFTREAEGNNVLFV
jgi:hypothetical protein